MREVKAVKINAADFAPYGTFCSMTEPEGYPLEGEIHKFYPDRISGTCVGTMAFSPIEVRKDERIVKMAEYHTTTCFRRNTGSGTCEGFPCTKGMHGKDQCSDLASVSTSGE